MNSSNRNVHFQNCLKKTIALEFKDSSRTIWYDDLKWYLLKDIDREFKNTSRKKWIKSKCSVFFNLNKMKTTAVLLFFMKIYFNCYKVLKSLPHSRMKWLKCKRLMWQCQGRQCHLLIGGNEKIENRINEQTNERTNKRTNKQTNEWTNEQTNKQTTEQTNERITFNWLSQNKVDVNNVGNVTNNTWELEIKVEWKINLKYV